jgi:thioester reductase-like protein
MKKLFQNLLTSGKVLTGATGSLGSHILAQLAENANVQKMFCPIRSSHKESATERLVSALKERSLLIPLTKVISLSSELSNPNFGLSASDLASLQSETTHIIHCAWAVNFALSAQSFEPQIQALHNLLSLSLSTPKPAYLLFCSSIGTAMATQRPAYIASARIPELRDASPTGYSRSKLIGERILEAAVLNSEAHATTLRIGQIVPARNAGS